MNRSIYEFELNYNSKTSSWYFTTAQERDDFYSLVKERFSAEEYKNKAEAFNKGNFIQISISNIRQDSLDSIADIVPYALYDGELIDDLTNFIETEYNKL